MTTVHRWGDPRVFERNASAAVEWGFDVFAFVPASGQLQMPEWARADRFHLVPLALPRNRLSRFLLSFAALGAVLKNGPFDLVHFHDPELIPAMLVFRLIRPGTKVLYDIHEELPLEVSSKAYIPNLAKPLVAGFATVLWWFARHSFHAFAPATEAIAAHWPPERTRVVHNYPKKVFSSPSGASKLDPFRVVFVGGLAEIRGIRELLIAVQNLRSKCPRVRLELYGPIMSQSLKPLIERARGEGWCGHFEWLSQSELAKHVRGSGVGVGAYHPQPDHMEALPTKFFEYMAMGVPILVSDFPLWKKIVSEADSGMTAAPTAEGLEAGLAFMISNPAKLVEWSENGRRAYEQRYRWEIESSNLKWLYANNGLETGAACGC